MKALYYESRDMAVILGTGSGKTAVALGPILYEKQITLWLSPLKELRSECKQRFEAAGAMTMCLSEVSVAEMDESLRIILVSPEELTKRQFSEKIKSLSTIRNRIRRVVVDEAHEFPMSCDFRECMAGAIAVRNGVIRVPIVFLTATAPKALLCRIADCFNVPRGNIAVIRGDCSRPNLKLQVDRLFSSSFHLMMNAVVKSVDNVYRANISSRADPGKIVVACLTRNHADQIQDALKNVYQEEECVVIKSHSKMSEIETQQHKKIWNESCKFVIMVATEKFLTGIDASNVRGVIVAGSCRSLVKFWQAAGRAGRDGLDADIIVQFHEGHLENAHGGQSYDVHEGEGSFTDWAKNANECRRLRIEKFSQRHADIEQMC